MSKFNIYYLNFSKVYEVDMLLNNEKTENITKVSSSSNNSKKSLNLRDGLDNKFFEYSKSNGEYYELKESIKVKETKSTILNKILNLCFKPSNFDEIRVGDLICLENIDLSFQGNEDNQKILALVYKNALEGINVEGYEINNLISTIIEGSFYTLKGCLNKEEFVFKIPMESVSEFESKYSIQDLLIGNLSVMGVYKGKITENELINPIFTFDNSIESSDSLIKYSSNSSNLNNDSNSVSDNDEIHYIDIFAIIQCINFKETQKDNVNCSFISKLKKLFRR